MAWHFPGGYSPKNWVGAGVRPASQNPYPIYDQNLRYSLPYLWRDQKFETQFMTRPSHQNPVSDGIKISSVVQTNFKLP